MWTEPIDSNSKGSARGTAGHYNNHSPYEAGALPKAPPCWTLLTLATTKGHQVSPDVLVPHPPPRPRHAKKDAFGSFPPSYKAARLSSAHTSHHAASSSSTRPRSCTTRAIRQRKMDSAHTASLSQKLSTSNARNCKGDFKSFSRTQAHKAVCKLSEGSQDNELCASKADIACGVDAAQLRAGADHKKPSTTSRLPLAPAQARGPRVYYQRPHTTRAPCSSRPLRKKAPARRNGSLHEE